MCEPRTSATRTATLLACAAFLLTPLTCHKPAESPPPDAANESDLTAKNAETDPPEPPPEPLVWPVEVHDPDRWLRVESIRNGSAGAWATGSFDPKRNKLDLHTHDVRAFSIDTGRVPINWERIVILVID